MYMLKGNSVFLLAQSILTSTNYKYIKCIYSGISWLSTGLWSLCNNKESLESLFMFFGLSVSVCSMLHKCLHFFVRLIKSKK